MTMSNNDMIGLFPDVIGCMDLPSLEIKKMYGGDKKHPFPFGRLPDIRVLGVSYIWSIIRE